MTKQDLLAKAHRTRNFATVAVSGHEREGGITQTVKELAEIVEQLALALPDDGSSFPVEKAEASQ